MNSIFVSPEFIARTKSNIQNGKGVWADVRYELARRAEELLTAGPWSVTFHPSPAVSGDPHDYFSHAPYWWPADPNNPETEFIRRDGQPWPGRFNYHKQDFIDMADTILMLSQAGYYLDEPKFLERALLLLRIWFLDEATRMNPHLEYGEAITNACTGRNAGIIVLDNLDRIIHAATFLETVPQYRPTIEKFREWVKAMLHWLVTSEKGIAESKAGNNHAAWWAIHVAAGAAFTGDQARLETVFNYYKNVLMPAQMETDGRLPRELQRTKSLQYSFYALDAFAVLCEIALLKNVDLWHYATADGKTLANCIKFIIPYMDNPFSWPYQEISGDVPEERLCLQLSALRLGIEDCAEVNVKRSRQCYLIRKFRPLGPTVLLPGHFIHN